MSEALVTITGNAVAAPDLKFISSGAAVAEFSLASTPRQFDRQSNEWVDGDTTFLRVKAWKNLAENAADSIAKGTPVIVHGKLKQRNWEKDGQKRSVLELEATDIGISVRANKRQEPAQQSAWHGDTTDQPPF